MPTIQFSSRAGRETSHIPSYFFNHRRQIYLDGEITLIISSPGGDVISGLAVYDVMQQLSNPIATVCLGSAASMAAVLLAAGTPGRRAAYPHSEIMIHQVLAAHTGNSLEWIQKDTDRDCFMTAQEAVDYDIIDRILFPPAARPMKAMETLCPYDSV